PSDSQCVRRIDRWSCCANTLKGKVMTEQEGLLALNAVPGLGSVGAGRLLAAFGRAVDVWGQGVESLRQHVNGAVAENIVHFSKDKFLSDEYNLVQRKGATVLSLADEGFPSMLRQVPGAPIVLYAWGDARCLEAACVAMVGSRACSYH